VTSTARPRRRDHHPRISGPRGSVAFDCYESSSTCSPYTAICDMSRSPKAAPTIPRFSTMRSARTLTTDVSGGRRGECRLAHMTKIVCRLGAYLCTKWNTHSRVLHLAGDRRKAFSIVSVGSQIADLRTAGEVGRLSTRGRRSSISARMGLMYRAAAGTGASPKGWYPVGACGNASRTNGARSRS
jgi:hypothetical protein